MPRDCFRTRVIEVTAPADMLAARLGRARAGGPQRTLRRAWRAAVALPDHVHVETVVNDASLAEGVARFLAALSRAASAAAR